MVKSDKIKTRVLVSLLMASVFSLTGCGGSSGGGGGTAASPNGIYTGSITGGQGADGFNGGEKAAIYNGKMLLFSSPPNISPQGSGINQIFEMPLTISGNNINGTINVYGNSGTPTEKSPASGSFEANKKVTISFAQNLDPNFADGTITLTANTASFNQGASLSLLANSNNNWNGIHGGFQDVTNLSFADNGDITGNAANNTGSTPTSCDFTGTTTVPDAGKNLYIVTITPISAANSDCSRLLPSIYTGFAWFEDIGNNTLNFAVADSNNQAGARAIVLTRN